MLVGLTGIGGGSLMTPLLILVLGVKPVVAIGADLAYGAVTKTVGGWRHMRQGTVDMRLSLWMASGSVPGALAGVVAIERLHRTHGKAFDGTVLVVLGITLLVVAAAVIARALFMPNAAARERESAQLDRRGRGMAIGLGVILGFILGFTSVGSGALIGLAFILVFKLTPHRVVGTDVFHAAILLWVAALAHLAAGNVDLGLTANILVGSVPGVWVGSGLISRIPPAGMRAALAAVLVAAALAVLDKGGFGIPIAAILGAPALVALIAFALHRARPKPPAAKSRSKAAA